ncbi:MAG: hypothetical protein V4651_12020 [Bacteroidota bacterium]
MIKHGLFLLSSLITSLIGFGQNTDLIPVNGFYIIQERVTFKKGDCVFCNPETMPDRIILDSSKKMIAKRTGNPLGYTYYEWRNRGNDRRSYEEIYIQSLKYKSVSYFTDSGIVRPPEKNTSRYNDWVYYFIGSPNSKQRYNGLWIAKKVRVELSKQTTDSLMTMHKYLKGKVLVGTKFWTELNFYENGKLQSTGTLITGLKEGSTDQANTPDNQFSVGLWTYYEINGQLNQTETISPIRRKVIFKR